MAPPIERTSILHLVPTLGYGGAERWLVDIVKATNCERFRHLVCYLTPPAPLANELLEKKIEVISLGLKKSDQWLPATLRVMALLKKIKPEIVHSWHFDAHLSGRIASLIPAIRSIVSLVNVDYEPIAVRSVGYHPLGIRLRNYIDRIMGTLAKSEYVAMSECVKRSASKHLAIPPSKISTIYGMVDEKRLEASTPKVTQQRKRLGLTKESKVILNVARLDKQKGQINLIQAFALSGLQHKNTHLVIVGHGSERANLESAISKLGLPHTVHLVGEEADVANYLRMADIFVFPSLYEGFGLALAEAMLAGLPCIANRIEPITEIIRNENEGWLLDTGNVHQLANAMSILMQDENWRKAIGQKGQISAKRFSSSLLIPEWEKLYSNSRPHS